MNQSTLVWTLGISLFACSALFSQERFELVAPQLRAASTAALTESELEITSSDGNVSIYGREPSFDSTDGQWIAYYDRNARQVIRWPSQNAGRFQIGSVQGNSVSYRASQMEIRSLGRPAGQLSQRPLTPGRQESDSLVLPAPTQGDADAWAGLGDEYSTSSLFQTIDAHQTEEAAAQLLLLAAANDRRELQLLARDGRNGFHGIPLASDPTANWWVAPAGRGFVRIQTYNRGRVYALCATQSRALVLEALAQDARQLWRVRGGQARAGYLLESAALPGWCLSMSGVGISLQPIAFVPQQLWMPLIAPVPPTFDPFWRSVSREVHANPPLEPAQLQLTNSHRNALFVLLGDARPGKGVQQIRIAAGDTAMLTLDRDSGATIVETIEIRSAAGLWDRQQLITAIPASAYYDLSVYEEFLQSIAIDQTGKSPNPIEDVNFMPKSVGWFSLPAGTALPRSGTMDAYQQARDANNPGAVRRIDLKQFDEPEGLSPAEQLLQEYQSRPRKSF